MSLIYRTTVGQNLDNIEISEGHDQREQSGDLNYVPHHWQVDVPNLLPPIRAIDRCRLVQLLGYGFERREIHDQEERRSDPDVDKDHRKARPVWVAEPSDLRDAQLSENPIEGAVRRVEQPKPSERAHRRRNDQRDKQHPAPLALALGREIVDEVRRDEPDHRLEDDG